MTFSTGSCTELSQTFKHEGPQAKICEIGSRAGSPHLAGQWLFHCFFVLPAQSSLFHLISRTDHSTNYCGQKINRIHARGCRWRGTGWTPSASLNAIVSSHWPETQLLPDLHLFVFSVGTSLHHIGPRWLNIALGDTLASFFLSSQALVLFRWIRIGSFYSLSCPLAFSWCLCSFSFLCFPSFPLPF